MAINEYMSPVKTDFIQDYVSQYIPLPFEEMQNALNVKQKAYDENEALKATISDQIAKVKAMPGKDSEDRDAILSSYENEIDNLIKSVGNDYSKIGPELRILANKANVDLTRGNLAQINKTGQYWEESLKTTDKMVSEGDRIAPLEQRYRQNMLEQHNLKGGTLGGSSFMYNLTPTADVQGAFQKYAEPMKADIKEYNKLLNDERLRIPGYDTRDKIKEKELLADKIKNTVKSLAENDPKLSGYFDYINNAGLNSDELIENLALATGNQFAYKEETRDLKDLKEEDLGNRAKLEKVKTEMYSNGIASKSSAIALPTVSSSFDLYRDNSKQISNIHTKIQNGTASSEDYARLDNLERANDISRSRLYKAIKVYENNPQYEETYNDALKILKDANISDITAATLLSDFDKMLVTDEGSFWEGVDIKLRESSSGQYGGSYIGANVQKEKEILAVREAYDLLKEDISKFTEANPKAIQPDVTPASEANKGNTMLLNNGNFANYVVDHNIPLDVYLSENLDDYFTSNGTKPGVKVEWEMYEPTSDEGNLYSIAVANITTGAGDEKKTEQIKIPVTTAEGRASYLNGKTVSSIMLENSLLMFKDYEKRGDKDRGPAIEKFNAGLNKAATSSFTESSYEMKKEFGSNIKFDDASLETMLEIFDDNKKFKSYKDLNNVPYIMLKEGDDFISTDIISYKDPETKQQLYAIISINPNTKQPFVDENGNMSVLAEGPNVKELRKNYYKDHANKEYFNKFDPYINR